VLLKSLVSQVNILKMSKYFLFNFCQKLFSTLQGFNFMDLSYFLDSLFFLCHFFVFVSNCVIRIVELVSEFGLLFDAHVFFKVIHELPDLSILVH
jgi:hypothetical protein